MTGVSWPLSNIPGFWQGFSWVFPSTFGIVGSSESAVWVLRFQIFCRNSEHSGYKRVSNFLATCLVFRQQLRSARLKVNLTAEVAEEEDEAEEIVDS